MDTVRIILAACLALAAAEPISAQTYRAVGSIPLGGPGRWDYVVEDPESGRVYVAHGDRIAVVDGRAGKVVGEVAGIPGGSHGIAISASTGQGFTDDGKAGTVVAFDLKTLAIRQSIPAREDADAVVAERRSGHVFVIEGDSGSITVVDPKSDRAVGHIQVGEKLEYAAADDRGSLFVAGAGAGDVVRIDTMTQKVTARWPAADCRSPHGLALDRQRGRLFVGCLNSEMVVLDARSGRVLDKLPIGRGSDSIAFDPTRHRVFSSNGIDGSVTAYQEQGDGYRALPVVPTELSGRTMAVDPLTGRLFVAAAAASTDAIPSAPRPRSTALQLLMFDPVD